MTLVQACSLLFQESSPEIQQEMERYFHYLKAKEAAKDTEKQE